MSYQFKLVAGDTDGLAFKKPDQKPFTKEEQEEIVAFLNSKMDELIRWENDGTVKKQIVVKTKNYILQDDSGNVKIKGSGLKATNKEKALQRFIKELIDLLLKDKKDQILFLYIKYAKEILQLKDMTDWCVKKTVTKAVLTSERTNERRVLEAIKDTNYSEGDKVYVFNKTDEELCLLQNFDGVYCVDTLLDKLYGTLCVFDTILDVEMIPKFTLKRNKELLSSLMLSDSTKTIATVIPLTKPKPPLIPPSFFVTR